ncbi:phage tail protein [Salmonella enterica]|nr:phage tail protein [Salmonella enterica]
MATKYLALLTNIGAAKLAKATALGMKVEITQMAVGDGNGVLPTPDPAQTTLIHEVRRAPLNMLTVDPANASQIIAEQVIPEDVGGWWIREIGLFDKDGDMIAVANCAETYKPQLQEGSGRVQAIRVILIVSSTEAVTLKIDPAVVLATRQYVDNKIIEVKTYADNVMKKHVAADNPHSQYPLIENALKELADAGLVSEALKNLGLGEATETLDDLRFCGALVSRGRKALNPVRIFFGADSLSEGTPDSYTQIVGGMMGAKTAQSGLLVPCRKSLVSNVSGFLEGRDAGTRGIYPRTYSLSGDALYGDELVNATMRHLPMVTSGVQMAWKKARLYYLAQPGGGTFDFRQYAASGTKGDIVSVDTHSDVYQIQYAEIAINPGVSQAYTEVLNGNGKLCLFLLEYINSDNDYVIFNGAQGGASAQDWNRLNKETQRQWMSLLRFDTCIYNAGTNDRYSRTAEDFRQDLSGYLTNLASADNAPHIIVVVPTQTKDYASTHAKDYPDVYSSVAEDNGFGFISMPLCLGDYAACSKRFGMLADGIHPSRAAHRAFGFFFASLLNMSVKNEPRPAFSAGGGGSDADPYEVDFSKWRSNGALVKRGVRTLIATFQPGAPYIHVYVDIEVAARVNPGVFSFIERRMRIHMRSGGSSANITQAQVLLNEEKTKLIESGWGFTFSTDADTSTGTLQIFMEVSRDCNIFSRVTDVRVLVGSVAAKGSALKMVNML